MAYWLPYFPGTYLWIVSVIILVELKDRNKDFPS